MPLSLIGEAVFARCLSAVKEERVAASQEIKPKVKAFSGDKARFIKDLRAALFASKIVSYAQGYQLMRAAAKTYKWKTSTTAASRSRGGAAASSARRSSATSRRRSSGYERVDKPRGQAFHTNWTGRGGTTTSQTYTV